MTAAPSVLLADDFPTTRAGVRSVLEARGFRVVGEAADGREALSCVQSLRPSVLVLDLGLPKIHGLDVARRARAWLPDLKIVIHTMMVDESAAAQAFRAGASAYVLKQDPIANLVAAIDTALEGERWLTPSLSYAAIETADRLFDSIADPRRGLSDREHEILRLTASGLTSREMGEQLGISSRTVESHRANLQMKLKLSTYRDLVRYALRIGLIS